MVKQVSKDNDGRRSWVLLVNIHLAVIIISDILFYVLPDKTSGLFGWIAGITSISLLILVATYKLYPHWYRNKK